MNFWRLISIRYPPIADCPTEKEFFFWSFFFFFSRNRLNLNVIIILNIRAYFYIIKHKNNNEKPNEFLFIGKLTHITIRNDLTGKPVAYTSVSTGRVLAVKSRVNFVPSEGIRFARRAAPPGSGNSRARRSPVFGGGGEARGPSTYGDRWCYYYNQRHRRDDPPAAAERFRPAAVTVFTLAQLRRCGRPSTPLPPVRRGRRRRRRRRHARVTAVSVVNVRRWNARAHTSNRTRVIIIINNVRGHSEVVYYTASRTFDATRTRVNVTGAGKSYTLPIIRIVYR